MEVRMGELTQKRAGLVSQVQRGEGEGPRSSPRHAGWQMAKMWAFSAEYLGIYSYFLYSYINIFIFLIASLVL